METNFEPFYVKVIVSTNQKNEGISITGNNRFEMSVREKPERGEANKKVLTLLNSYYKRPMGGVTIISGHHSPIKLIRIGR